jgi:hypothetical protein
MDELKKFDLLKRKFRELLLEAWGKKIDEDFMLMESRNCMKCGREFLIKFLSATVDGFICDECLKQISRKN